MELWPLQSPFRSPSNLRLDMSISSPALFGVSGEASMERRKNVRNP